MVSEKSSSGDKNAVLANPTEAGRPFDSWFLQHLEEKWLAVAAAIDTQVAFEQDQSQRPELQRLRISACYHKSHGQLKCLKVGKTEGSGRSLVQMVECLAGLPGPLLG